MKKAFLRMLKLGAGMFGLAVVAMVAIGVLAVIFGGGGEVIVTQAEFQCVRNGMTYEQVEACIGDPGTMDASAAIPGGGSIVSYSWMNPDGSNAGVTFQDGRVTMKASAMLP